MQRRVDVVERRRDDEHVGDARVERGPHPIARAALRRRRVEVARRLGPLRREPRDRRRQARRRPLRRRAGARPGARAGEPREVGDAGAAHDPARLPRPELDVDAGHRAGDLVARGSGRLEHALDGAVIGLERAVRAAEEEGAKRCIGRHVRPEERDRGQHEHAYDEAAAQRHLRPSRRACSPPAGSSGSAAGRPRRASGAGS